MKRLLLDRLRAWKASPVRKPLILKGLRQVGKTWLLKEFGRTEYEHVAYFNFEESPEYKDFFAHTKDVRRILPNLAMASAQTMTPGNTLIIFDEIQEAPDALNALKYFHEKAPEYHVACAGSLLGIALARPSSFPVGQVDFLQVRPLTFTEFLLASGKENLAAYLAQIDGFSPIPSALFQPLVAQLKMYYVTGGLPEAVPSGRSKTSWKPTNAISRSIRTRRRIRSSRSSGIPCPRNLPERTSASSTTLSRKAPAPANTRTPCNGS